MEWLIKHWWILVLVFLVGVIINVIKDLNRVDHKNSSTTNPICRRTVILTINGTTTTTGRSTTSRKTVSLPLSRYRPPVTPLSGVTAFR